MSTGDSVAESVDQTPTEYGEEAEYRPTENAEPTTPRSKSRFSLPSGLSQKVHDDTSHRHNFVPLGPCPTSGSLQGQRPDQEDVAGHPNRGRCDFLVAPKLPRCANGLCAVRTQQLTQTVVDQTLQATQTVVERTRAESEQWKGELTEIQADAKLAAMDLRTALADIGQLGRIDWASMASSASPLQQVGLRLLPVRVRTCASARICGMHGRALISAAA